MDRLEVYCFILRSPDEVFAFLTDFTRLSSWRRVSDLRIEPQAPPHVGARLHMIVRGVVGRMKFTNEVVQLDPSRRFYSDRSIAGPFAIHNSWKVEACDGGSRVVWTTEFETGSVNRLFATIFRRAILRREMKELKTLRRILENDSTT